MGFKNCQNPGKNGSETTFYAHEFKVITGEFAKKSGFLYSLVSLHCAPGRGLILQSFFSRLAVKPEGIQLLAAKSSWMIELRLALIEDHSTTACVRYGSTAVPNACSRHKDKRTVRLVHGAPITSYFGTAKQ